MIDQDLFPLLLLIKTLENDITEQINSIQQRHDNISLDVNKLISLRLLLLSELSTKIV